MARTANAARKQVNKSTSVQGTTKEPVKPKEEPPRKEEPRQVRQVAEKRPAKSLSVSVPTISQMPKPTPKRASKNILKEIRYYQNNIGFLVPRALVVRIVRSILGSVLKSKTSEDLRITAVSLNVIHESIENHIVCLLELSYMAARHAKRVTLFPTDIRLVNRIRGSSAQ